MICLLTNSLGVFLSATKSHWTPSTRVTFLGFIVDSIAGTVEVMPKKHESIKKQIHDVIAQSKETGIWDMHLVEIIRGKLISWIIVVPDMRIYIREMNVAVSRAYEKDNFQIPVEEMRDLEIAEEMMIWTRIPTEDLKRKWLDDRHVVAKLKSLTISTDASGFAAGLAFGPQRNLQYRTFTWNLSECDFAIHYKVILSCFNSLLNLFLGIMGYRKGSLCTRPQIIEFPSQNIV